MTEKVNPSPFRPAEAFKTGGSIYYNNSRDNFIVPSNEQTEIASQDTGIDETTFTAFGESHTSSSFDVTIEQGEAFIFGSWLAIDTSTTVTLASNTADQTVYVGWDKDAANQVIIGLNSAFSNTASNDDQRIPLYDFTTDGNGVTSVSDRRNFEAGFINAEGFIGEDTHNSGHSLQITSDEYMVVAESYTINGNAQIDGDLVVVSNEYSHDQLADVDPKDHLEVLKKYQILLNTGVNPAFDSTLQDVYDNETGAIDVTVAPTNGKGDKYSFNFDAGREWSNGSWNIPLTINWDIDPGSNLGVDVRVHKRT